MKELRIVNGKIQSCEISTARDLDSIELTPIKANAERAKACELSRSYPERKRKELKKQELIDKLQEDGADLLLLLTLTGMVTFALWLPEWLATFIK